ncbi:unnamed protein product [Pleuronectes platessa]|uniref:Sema domain-containing protein n=1 Tax=Pleuronectes platessa TaxID=8262 RepID=A0A9N7VKR2_PLEPL|nr:unnamed protein product [Pleuronectes platessa]
MNSIRGFTTDTPSHPGLYLPLDFSSSHHDHGVLPVTLRRCRASTGPRRAEANVANCVRKCAERPGDPRARYNLTGVLGRYVGAEREREGGLNVSPAKGLRDLHVHRGARREVRSILWLSKAGGRGIDPVPCVSSEVSSSATMRLMPGSPPPVLPLLLALTLAAASLPPLSSGAAPFPQDLEPISSVGRDSSYLYPSFQGLMSDNDTVRLGLDFQRMLRINHMLYIAARDHVFAVNLAASSEQIIPRQKLTWKTKDVDKCTVRGKNSDECYNYIKVLVPRNDETLFACGTNAFNPTCRNYKMSTLEQEGEEVVGQARCPFESRQSNVGLFAGGDFYSATMTDFLASDAVIYRSLGESSPVLRTVKYDSKWLREPHFLHAIEYGNYVYFFLSEIAVEYTTLGKVVFSRVARVCKNDNGGSPRVLERYWTSFLKARLNCSVPGDSFFYFDVLQSLTNVMQINHRPAVLGVFTTQANSITGSAVCAFYMDDIEKAFSGKFKEQRNSESAWTPVPEEQVPKPRPGCCAGEGSAAAYKSSTTFPDETLTFIKSYPLMDESVPSVNDRPYFTRTTSRFKLTQIAVDTSAGPYKNYTVVFLGSDNGHVLKILASTEGANASFGTQLLEDIDVYNPNKCNVRGEDRRVLGLELDRDHHALFVAFSSCVIRVPLSRCSDYTPARTDWPGATIEAAGEKGGGGGGVEGGGGGGLPYISLQAGFIPKSVVEPPAHLLLGVEAF